jgi:hypothetical protein
MKLTDFDVFALGADGDDEMADWLGSIMSGWSEGICDADEYRAHGVAFGVECEMAASRIDAWAQASETEKKDWDAAMAAALASPTTKGQGAAAAGRKRDVRSQRKLAALRAQAMDAIAAYATALREDRAAP